MNRQRLDHGAERTLSVVRQLPRARRTLVPVSSSWDVSSETIARSSLGGRPKRVPR